MDLGKPQLVEVEREELVSLKRIRRLAGMLLCTTDSDHVEALRELDSACGEHYRRFEANPQQRWRRPA